MTIRMENLERLSLAEMKEFVTTNRHVGWSAVEGAAVYGLIERVLKGTSVSPVEERAEGDREKLSGQGHGLESRASDTTDPTLDRNATYREKADPAPEFPAAEDLSGPAARHLCRRGWEVFADKRSQRLGGSRPR